MRNSGWNIFIWHVATTKWQMCWQMEQFLNPSVIKTIIVFVMNGCIDMQPKVYVMGLWPGMKPMHVWQTLWQIITSALLIHLDTCFKSITGYCEICGVQLHFFVRYQSAGLFFEQFLWGILATSLRLGNVADNHQYSQFRADFLTAASGILPFLRGIFFNVKRISFEPAKGNNTSVFFFSKITPATLTKSASSLRKSEMSLYIVKVCFPNQMLKNKACHILLVAFGPSVHISIKSIFSLYIYSTQDKVPWRGLDEN